LEIIKSQNFLFRMVPMLIQFIFFRMYDFQLFYTIFHLFLRYFISFWNISSLSRIFFLFLKCFISFWDISSLYRVFHFSSKLLFISRVRLEIIKL
jgi:hypothetical protein